jgi:hypothetical protein
MLSTDKKECWVLAPDDRVVSFHYVHYFVSNRRGYWRCLLCDAGPMRMDSVRHHRNGIGHSSAIEALAQARSVFEARIKTLGRELWRQQAVDAMSSVSLNHTSVEDRRAHYSRFVQTLERYEQMERLSLLELAIWKANCTSYGVVFSVMQALESGFDPISYLRRHCHYRECSPLSLEVSRIHSYLKVL